MDRIRHTSYQFDGSGDYLVQQTWKQYAEGTPLLGLWAALNEEGLLVGHALADIQFWSGRTVAWVSQVILDDEVTTLEQQRRFMETLDQWVKDVNVWAKSKSLSWQVSEILMMTPRMTDAWARKAGFDMYRQVFRRMVRM